LATLRTPGKIIKTRSVKGRGTLSLLSWGRKVKERDGFKCQSCGYDKDRRFLHAHHIKQKSKYPNLALNINNGITLCIYCHALQHPTFISFVFRKPKKVTKKELIEFLTFHKRNNTYGKTKTRKKGKVT